MEVTGEIVDVYTLGGDKRGSIPRYYVAVEYQNDKGERDTLRGIKRAVKEVVGDRITFYLDIEGKPQRMGVLTENELFIIEGVLGIHIGLVVMNLYMKNKRQNNETPAK